MTLASFGFGAQKQTRDYQSTLLGRRAGSPRRHNNKSGGIDDEDRTGDLSTSETPDCSRWLAKPQPNAERNSTWMSASQLWPVTAGLFSQLLNLRTSYFPTELGPGQIEDRGRNIGA